MDAVNCMLPVELIYRELTRPKVPQAKPASERAKNRELTRDDVNAIIARTRGATPEELQFLISHRKELDLTEGERNQLGVDLSVAMALRARQLNGKREDVNARFIHDTLGLAITPYGLVERRFFEAQLRSGAEAIVNCQHHNPPKCACWRTEREALWYIAVNHGDNSPEACMSVKVWEALEDIETSARSMRWGSGMRAG
jgi:hypothetical protein